MQIGIITWSPRGSILTYRMARPKAGRGTMWFRAVDRTDPHRSENFVVKPIHLAALLLPLLAGCLGEPVPTQEMVSLREARAGFKPKPLRVSTEREPMPDPPPGVFRKVIYHSPAGEMGAYISEIPDDSRKHPAIIWITGGDCNSIGDVWSPMPGSNDQSASAYRTAGIVMMFPALRGGNQNPGVKEGYFGEVDDVVAAADYLARQGSVDPKRIYLGGHSTGGTLVLLVSECRDRFRAVFAFGPVSEISSYPSEFTPFDTSDRRGVELRSPGRWLGSIKRPTFVIEGTGAILSSLEVMAKACKNPLVHFVTAKGADHFQVLGPANALVARKILADQGATCNITLTDEEASRPFAR
jgi:acetyl esterase/lipase